jgi:hypothetical protein
MKPKSRPQDAPLDKYAFADQREDLDVEEPNNENEESLYYSLRDHIVSNVKPDDQEANLLAKILKDDLYSDVFVKPDVSSVFRGMKVKIPYVSSFLSREQIEELNNAQMITLSGHFVYVPRKKSKISSWSKNKESSVPFYSVSFADDEHYSVLLYASTKENDGKFLDLQKIYRLDNDMREFSYEREIISVGQIDVNKIEFFLKTKRKPSIKQQSYVSMTEQEAKDKIKSWIKDSSSTEFQSILSNTHFRYINYLVDAFLKQLDHSDLDKKIREKFSNTIKRDYSELRKEYLTRWVDSKEWLSFLEEAIKIFLSRINNNYKEWYKNLLYIEDLDIAESILPELAEITVEFNSEILLEDFYEYFYEVLNKKRVS